MSNYNQGAAGAQPRTQSMPQQMQQPPYGMQQVYMQGGQMYAVPMGMYPQ